tara:strand:- start:1062 stop:1670 length:609 start_codon:yes stop_codon:yes gene_type:complete
MENQETVKPELEVDRTSEALAEQPQEAQEVVQEEETMVPLHAVQKERRRRQDAEQELRALRDHQAKANEPEDTSRYESATKEDLGNAKSAWKRELNEENWARENPDKFQKINDDLPEFLKLRPNLASAIDESANRYAEAWELMSKLTPKQQQQQQIAQKPKAPAPGSPSGIPKAASMSETVDLMNMSDSEFNSWRQQRRKQR